MLKEAKVSERECELLMTVKMVWKGMQLAERGVETVVVEEGDDCNVEGKCEV